MNSKMLEHLQGRKVIPDWIAERLDQLSSEALKEQAVHGLKPVIQEAVDRYCDRLEHPEGKVLYQAPVVPAPGQPLRLNPKLSDKVFTLITLGAILYGAFRGLMLIAHWIDQAWSAWLPH